MSPNPSHFQKKWHETVLRKQSILCVGLDPAEPHQRPEATICEGTSKLDFCLGIIEEVAPYSAAIKINHNYVRDLSRSEIQVLTNAIHRHEMLALDDSKIADIGATNVSAFYHMQKEGFDATTFAPFPGNMKEAVKACHNFGLGLISLVLMSNQDFCATKNARFEGVPGYLHYAQEVHRHGADGMVLGAPSSHNHISQADLVAIKVEAPHALVLAPGLGAQGGDFLPLLALFGSGLIANVGREIIYDKEPGKRAQLWRERFETRLKGTHDED